MAWSGALLLSVVFAAIVAAVFPAGRRPLGVRARWRLASFSHWLLDLVMHTPDMPLLDDDSTKVGLGLWDHVGHRPSRSSSSSSALGDVALRPYGRARRTEERPHQPVGLLRFMAVAQVYWKLRVHRRHRLRRSPLSALVGYVATGGVAAWVESRAVGTHAR